MPDDSAVEIIRAAVDAIVPSTDGEPSAADLGVQDHVVESIEMFVPGFVDLLATLLNAYAADVRPGAPFTDLTLEERQQVIRAMSLEENPDMRDVIDGLLVFTYGGFYSEWTGRDRTTGEVTAPRAWADTGFHGPVLGHPVYREEA
jgi:Gluconate 2-dehydrogenase subunit 3